MFESTKQLNKNRRGIRRRVFLIAGVAAGAGAFLYRWWRAQPRPILQRAVSYVTANRDFFVVSISSSYPAKADLETWRLGIYGLGGKSRFWSLDQLQDLESLRIHRTLMCISNRVGGDSIGNAEWTGTPLAPLLEPFLDNVREGDLRVVFRGMDGFHSSVPLAVARDPESFLAWEMNGAPLPREHGFPLRVLLPGKYGMKQPRWLERIEITEESVSGYWEKRGWSDQCDVKTTARIDSARPVQDANLDMESAEPPQSQPIPRSLTIPASSNFAKAMWLVEGVAYCGGLAVRSVEVSDDEGQTWHLARLTSPAAVNAWATWSFDWTPARPGEYVLAARAIDSDGGRQIESYSGSFPDGSTGIHRVIVEV